METVGNRVAAALYVLAMVAVVVGVDVLFFRHHFWDRLIVNVGVVLVFAAFYLRFRNVHERSRTAGRRQPRCPDCEEPRCHMTARPAADEDVGRG